MKRCPRCSQTYTDDMMFCLSDGTPLLAGYQEPEQSTVVRPKALRNDGQRGVSPLFKYLTFALLSLFVISAAGAAGIWFFWPRGPEVVSRNELPKNGGPNVTISPTTVPTISSTAAPAKTPAPNETPERRDSSTNVESERAKLEGEKQRLAEERRKLEEQQRKAAETPTPVPEFVDPGTTRIAFSRGSVGKTISGMIGHSRTFVLRTLGGQYLTARVRSPRGCAAFGNGSAIDAFVTREGDSYLYLTNNCGTPSRFVLNVVVR